jgi:pimeloyl-ACP methyl ester carboxylesterase
MTEFLDINGGQIAYDVAGDGPLVVLSHGMGEHRGVYRFLAPALAQAGYRVASADLRGHGESSMGWTSVTGKAAITRTDVANDLLALIGHLGGPAVIVGHSLSGGAATIAAAQAPELVHGIVEIDPFTRTQPLELGALLRNRRYRQGMTRLMGTQMLRSLRMWMRYLDLAYPSKPADYAEYMAGVRAKLTEPGRMGEFAKTGKSTPADAQAKLPDIRCPALIIMGTLDPDFPDPRAEGEAIAADMPAGLGSVALIDGAGHYPHAQCPGEVAALVIPFLNEHTRAEPGPVRNRFGGGA